MSTNHDFLRKIFNVPGLKKDRLAAKDIANLVMSATALLISAYTMYYNVLLEDQDLAIYVVRDEKLEYIRSGEKSGEVVLKGSERIVFINSGNQSSAILNIVVYGTIDEKEKIDKFDLEDARDSTEISNGERDCGACSERDAPNDLCERYSNRVADAEGVGRER